MQYLFVIMLVGALLVGAERTARHEVKPVHYRHAENICSTNLGLSNILADATTLHIKCENGVGLRVKKNEVTE